MSKRSRSADYAKRTRDELVALRALVATDTLVSTVITRLVDHTTARLKARQRQLVDLAVDGASDLGAAMKAAALAEGKDPQVAALRSLLARLADVLAVAGAVDGK